MMQELNDWGTEVRVYTPSEDHARRERLADALRAAQKPAAPAGVPHLRDLLTVDAMKLGKRTKRFLTYSLLFWLKNGSAPSRQVLRLAFRCRDAEIDYHIEELDAAGFGFIKDIREG